MDHLHQNGLGVILGWWHLLEYPFHQGVQRWVKELNAFYKSRPALHEIDASPEDFEWADFKDAESSVISYLRKGKSPEANE